MKKSTLYICLALIVVCLAIAGVYVMLNRSTDRDATAAEIAANQAYLPNWDAIGESIEIKTNIMTEKGALLSLCTYSGDEQIGSNVHQVYTSETLGQYLHRCETLSEITLMNETLYITYFADDGDMVILAYTDAGLSELGVYDAETDSFYHEMDGKCVVWSKFRNGFQFGA